jgi:hypothetical protein
MCPKQASHTQQQMLPRQPMLLPQHCYQGNLRSNVVRTVGKQILLEPSWMRCAREFCKIPALATISYVFFKNDLSKSNSKFLLIIKTLTFFQDSRPLHLDCRSRSCHSCKTSTVRHREISFSSFSKGGFFGAFAL